MKKFWMLAASAAYGMVLIIGCPAQAETWNLASQWSSSRNPNGTWTYGCVTSGLTSWLHNYDTTTSNWLGTSSVGWIQGSTTIPGIMKCYAANPLGMNIPRGYVAVHTDNSSNGYQTGAKWTAPYDMKVNLSGGLWMPRNLGRVNCVSLIVNGVVLINKAIIPSYYNSSMPYQLAQAIVDRGGNAEILNNIEIHQGQSIWLVFGPANGTGDADFVGMDFTVAEVEAWDMADHWSAGRNPNAAFTLGCASPSLRTWSHDLTTSYPNWLGSGSQGWASANEVPGVSKCSSANPWGIDLPSGRIVAHTDSTGNGYQTGAKWTAPCDMRINISGGVWMPRYWNRSNTVSLVVDGIVLIDKIIIPQGPYTSSNPFTLVQAISDAEGNPASLGNIDIRQGQSVWLVCGPTNGAGDADFVGIDFKVTRVPLPDVYHPAAVVATPSGVSLANGSILNTRNSQTHGLQEAINYACDYGYDLFVLPGVYSLNAGLAFQPMQIKTIRMKDVTLNFSPAVTGSAITFDSTMMVDMYMTGSINAPSASYGVNFQPVNPHPLDGPKLGIKGIVDSIFFFGNVHANSYSVRMDSYSASINDCTFAFAGMSSALHGSQISYRGSSYASTNLWVDPRTDDPIPFDIFKPDNCVVVNSPKCGERWASVFLPGGSKLNFFYTSTCGVQEAVNYACNNNLNLVVFGRGIKNSSPFADLTNSTTNDDGGYRLDATLSWPAMADKLVRIYGVDFSVYASTGMLLRDMYQCDFEFTGQLGFSGSNYALHVQPTNGGLGVRNSVLRLTTIATNAAYGAYFDTSFNSIQNNLFCFSEINGPTQAGLAAANPSATTWFLENNVRAIHCHGFRTYGCQLGLSATNADRIRSNTVLVYTSPDGFSANTGVDIWGTLNAVYFRANGSSLSKGAVFQPGSSNNTLFYGTINATTKITNNGTGNNLVSWTAMTIPNGMNAAAPVIGPQPGTYAGMVSVTMSDPTPNSVIHYTLDGTNPTTSSPTYSAPVTLTGNATVLAKAWVSGMLESTVAKASYTVLPERAIDSIRGLANGTSVGCSGTVVTQAFGSGYFYIEESNRFSGIRVSSPTIVSPGQAVSIAGKIWTNSTTGERYILADSVLASTTTDSVGPLGVSCKSIGGSQLGLQAGIPGILGLNNIGLLITAWGKVTPISPRRFLINDGSGQVTVELAAGSVPPANSFVSVTGVSSCEKTGGVMNRLIRVGAGGGWTLLRNP